MNRGEGWEPYRGAAISLREIAEGAMISGLHPLLREAVTKAEINFKFKEERGQWHDWRAADENSVPPWWEAGAEYIWVWLL